MRIHRILLGLLGLSIGLGVGMRVNAQSLYWIAYPGSDLCIAYDISNDGNRIVGSYHDPALQLTRAFIWDRSANAYIDLGDLGGGHAVARAISGNGQVVVGWSMDAQGNWRAYQWQNNVSTNLGAASPDGLHNFAYDVSADGTLVVGACDFLIGGQITTQGVYWNSAGPTTVLPNSTMGAYSISQSGDVIVGVSPCSWGYCGATWFADDQFSTRYYAPFVNWSQARAASADGQVVGGYIAGPVGYRCRRQNDPNNRWSTPETFDDRIAENRQYLATYVHALSGDGSVAVGVYYLRERPWDGRAARWNAIGVLEDLNAVYSALLADGSRLLSALSTTPNGRFIVGLGYNATTNRYEGFLLDTVASYTRREGDVDGNGCVDDSDLLTVLFLFGDTGQTIADINADGVVDDADLLEVLFHFGQGC